MNMGDFATAGASSSVSALLLVGVALVLVAAMIRGLSPKFETLIANLFFKGREMRGRTLRTTGGFAVVLAIGLLCLVVGIAKLIAGH